MIVPADYKLFQYAYQGNDYEGWPVFVTTDVAYHEWHLVFDKLLRSLEQQVLLPKLEQLVSGALTAAQHRRQSWPEHHWPIRPRVRSRSTRSPPPSSINPSRWGRLPRRRRR